MYDIGIIGGMGPAATAEIFKRIVDYTLAQKDQDHIKICILNDPTIPDRTEHIINNLESPLKGILNNIQIAEIIKCKYFIIPCNTAHYFYKEYENIKNIQFINMVEETCKYVAYKYPKKDICILATLGTVKADIYKKIGYKYGNIFYPSKKINKNIMSIIKQIKAGEINLKELTDRMLKDLKKEIDFDKTVFVLACTELSLLLPYITGDFVDAMDVLVGVVIKKCNKSLNSKKFKLYNKYFENYR